jgi:hypothetical protein
MKTGYTYTLLRYIHDTVTGECVNVGVALLSPDAHFVGARCRDTSGRIIKVFPGVDGDSFKFLMQHIEKQFSILGDQLRQELPLGPQPSNIMDLALRVLPADDSSLQWAPNIGSGLTEDPKATLDALFKRMVMFHDEKKAVYRRDDTAVWRNYRRDLETQHVLKYLKPKTISCAGDQIEFGQAWKNNVWHCLAPVSFDLASDESMREKAHRWLGQLMSLKASREKFKVYLLLGEPQQPDLKHAFTKTLRILEMIPVTKELVRERDSACFAKNLAADIAKHVKPKTPVIYGKKLCRTSKLQLT